WTRSQPIRRSALQSTPGPAPRSPRQAAGGLRPGLDRSPSPAPCCAENAKARLPVWVAGLRRTVFEKVVTLARGARRSATGSHTHSSSSGGLRQRGERSGRSGKSSSRSNRDRTATSQLRSRFSTTVDGLRRSRRRNGAHVKRASAPIAASLPLAQPPEDAGEDGTPPPASAGPPPTGPASVPAGLAARRRARASMK